MVREIAKPAVPGGVALAGSLAAAALAVIVMASFQSPPAVVFGVIVIAASILGLAGLFIVNPNEGKVLQLFGNYVGTVREPGLKWANPFYLKRKISLRIRNFESTRLKVNDHDGNPIEIAAIIVWKVVDTAEAVFEVDDYQNYVHVQTESALRNLATQHPYDAHNDGQLSLRANTTEVADLLKHEVEERLAKAGVEVIEARMSHLAYAPEIASVMLRRQQAAAVVAARTQIVFGAVSMVEMALTQLAEKHIVELDADRKAAMVSNLLVILCGEREAQPIVNAGTIYS